MSDKVEVEWHDVREELPQKSGAYLTIDYQGTMDMMDYSARHRLFNVGDEEEEPMYPVPCTWWAEVPRPEGAPKQLSFEELWKRRSAGNDPGQGV